MASIALRRGGQFFPSKSFAISSQQGLLKAFSSHSDFAPKSHVQGAEDEFVQRNLKKLVTQNKVVLFMKGTPVEPQCGFSRVVAQVLDHYGMKDYAYVNVLNYPEVREGVKKFSDWPTLPQLYVNGEFIGGCDIVMDMHREGELSEIFADVTSE